MGITLLVTCGASLLSNAKRSNLEIVKKYIEPLLKADIGSLEYEKAKDYASKGHDVFKELLNYLRQNGSKASAEINTIGEFLRAKSLTYRDIKIYLYRSDTAIGLLIASILEEYLKENGTNVETVEVKGFGTAKTLNEFQEGMVDLMTKIIRVTRSIKHDKGNVYVIATGGFKPETTAAVIASLLAKADGIYYIYENSERLVEIPAIPLDISQDAIILLDKIFHINDHSKRRWSVSIDELLSMDMDITKIEELEFMGLVKRKGELNNKIEIREWVKELIL